MDDRRQRFETLALPHMDAAYNLARWLSRSPVEADDIVQDAMLRAFRAFDGFRGGDIKAWLLTIVRNCWLSTVAGSHRRVHASLEDEELPATDASPEDTAIQAGTQRRMDLLIAQLAPEFREVLILREMDDLSYREIAEITGTPIGTVMSRLARARTQLRESAKEFL
jgi:RNA polymerase sigma-70 factor (ECF subfamily)